MTKEELEKEAEDFAIKSYGNDAFTQVNMPHMIEPVRLNLKIGYLAGAEPREKRIAELSNRNQELLESCEGATMMYKDLCKAKEIIQKLIANAPNTYSGTDVELQQKKMFSFQDAVNKAEQFLKECK